MRHVCIFSTCVQHGGHEREKNSNAPSIINVTKMFAGIKAVVLFCASVNFQQAFGKSLFTHVHPLFNAKNRIALTGKIRGKSTADAPTYPR